MKRIIITFAVCAFTVTLTAQDYQTRVIARGLARPTGIAAKGSATLYFTQLPTPGLPGSMGGQNTVNQLQLGTGAITALTIGEPEPTNLALDKHGTLYWTCKSAGVILRRNNQGDVSLFLGGLAQPSGISVDQWNHVYFTLVPTPGVPGSMGGNNSVQVSDEENTVELSSGEPEPSDIAVSRNGTAYWTCKTAGVILARPASGPISLLRDGLDSPTGIALDHQGRKLYWTEVPTPGIPGSQGGQNKVVELDLRTMQTTVVNMGDPEPTDVTVTRNGHLYWTCTSAGVIVEARRTGGR